MKGFLDIKLPLNIVLIFMIMILTVIFGFAYIGTFFNALGIKFEAGSGNWMIALSVIIVLVVVITYLEVMKKRGKFFFR